MEGPCVGVPNPLGGPVVHTVSLGWECSAHPLAHFSGVSSIEKCRGLPRNGSGKEETARIAVLGKTTRKAQLDAAPNWVLE